MQASFWETLRQGFMQLRSECAINPPNVPAGQLIAKRDAAPEHGRWNLRYRNGGTRIDVVKRFSWHAHNAAARLGFRGNEDGAVTYWLNRLWREAPEGYIRARGGLIELLDVCGLSGEYCRKCEAQDVGLPAAPEPETLTEQLDMATTRTDPTDNGVPDWAGDLATAKGRKSALRGWKSHWTTKERNCTNQDLVERAIHGRDLAFLNQWKNGTTRLKRPARSSRIQAIEAVLCKNIPPKWHPEAKKPHCP